MLPRWKRGALYGVMAIALLSGTLAAGAPDQVTRGEQVFRNHCMACHGEQGKGSFEAPALNGRRTRARFASAQKLYEFAAAYMPFNSPGSLAPDQYWDAVAYILWLQGAYPAGGLAVGPANAAGVTWDQAEILIYVGSQRLAADVPPEVRSGRTLVPLRAIFEELGAEVTWDGASRMVTAVKGGVTVRLQIDNPVATVNGTERPLDQPPVISNGRTLVPVRFVSEALGARVEWEAHTRAVLITPP